MMGMRDIVPMQERLQKILSARGICSRRAAEKYIEQGLITVNGKRATLGQKADPASDTIIVDGRVIEARNIFLYSLLHKPVGVVTTNVHRRGQRTVRDLLPKELQGKVFPVGRLDKDTSGLLLFTNDGELAYRLTHPKFFHEKEYEVTVREEISDGALRKLQKGITILGKKTKQAKVKRINGSTFRIALTEGRNRQIRRMCQNVGSAVVALKRVRIGNIVDALLPEGNVRPLSQEERTELLRNVMSPEP